MTESLIAQLFGRTEGDDEAEQEVPNPKLPEAALMELRAAQEDFIRKDTCRFAVGDLIIPKNNGLVDRHDELPRVVVAINPAADYIFDVDPRSPHFGMRYDIRVLGFNRGHLIAFWGESSYFEPYQMESPDGRVYTAL